MSEPGDQTRAVHGGEERPNGLRSITPPIARASTYRFESLAEALAVVEGRAELDDYSRYANPTVRTAERKIAALEGAEESVLFASGMAAVTTTLLALVRAGQHIVIPDDCYRPTEQFVTETLPRFGVETTMVQAGDLDALAEAVRPGATRGIFVESPSNPFNRVADLARLREIRRANRGVQLIVDATFATPFNQRPLALGADLVIHSATKFLGGHNDLLAGVVSGRSGIISAIRDVRSQLGPVADPEAAYLLCRGIKSLGPRMRAHNENAQAVAEFLAGHPQVREVWYPGLASHPDHALAAATMRGFGGVVTLRHTGDLAATHRICDAARVFQIAASLGGAESLLHPPAIFSYWDLDPAERQRRGMHDDLIRLAIGIESAEDLVADLAQALEHV